MSSQLRVFGDPERLAEEVTSKVKESLENKVSSAIEASRKIIEKAYSEADRIVREEVTRALRLAREQLESYAAKRDVELRKRLASIKAEAVESVVNEALAKLKSRVGEEAYARFIERRLEEAVKTVAATAKSIVIVPVEGDAQIVRSAARRIAKPRGVSVSVSEEAARGLGGFIVRTDTGLSLDYRLEVLLSTVIEEARYRVASLLFKE
ncbi:MAG: hypothetical protein DSY37_04280 [Hyperthermus sp.]|nr:MAG: hypothetical protein DSY37_04280 [Hyperthermus sp.]